MIDTMKSTALAIGLAGATLAGTAGIASAAPRSSAPAAAPTTQTAKATPVQFWNARCYRDPVYRTRWTPWGWRQVFVGYRTRCYDDPGFGLRFYFGY